MAINIYKKDLKEQVDTLYFKTDSKVLKQIIKEYEDFEKMLNHLKSIDIEGIEPMTRINETPIFNLREDVSQTNIDYHLFLKNAPDKTEDYIVINNVVEND